MLAICFYNKGCQLEHLESHEEALESYKLAHKLESAKSDPFKMGPALMARLQIRKDADSCKSSAGLLKQFQGSI